MKTKLGAAALLVALLAACGGDDDGGDAAETTTTTTTEATETTDAPGGSPDDAAHDPTDDTEPATTEVDPWRLNATDHREEIGETFDYDCPPGGDPATIWGTDEYTDDSGVCTAAVHAGLIDFADGGEVTIVMVEGADAYEGSERNGVTSEDYGEWPAGFTFATDDES